MAASATIAAIAMGSWMRFQRVRGGRGIDRYGQGRGSEDFEELEGGGFGVDFVYDVCDAVVSVGDEGGADGAHVFAAGHFLFLPYAECLVDFGGGVGEEYEWQLMFFCEFEVAGY